LSAYYAYAIYTAVLLSAYPANEAQQKALVASSSSLVQNMAFAMFRPVQTAWALRRLDDKPVALVAVEI
jgi:hypothetical protein